MRALSTAPQFLRMVPSSSSNALRQLRIKKPRSRCRGFFFVQMFAAAF
jgi:hypothetical protein